MRGVTFCPRSSARLRLRGNLLGAHDAVETRMRAVSGKARGGLPESGALGGGLKVLGALPAGDVHKLEVRAGGDGLVRHRVHIARLGGQVVPRLLPGSDEPLGFLAGTSNALINTSGSAMACLQSHVLSTVTTCRLTTSTPTDHRLSPCWSRVRRSCRRLADLPDRLLDAAGPGVAMPGEHLVSGDRL